MESEEQGSSSDQEPKSEGPVGKDDDGNSDDRRNDNPAEGGNDNGRTGETPGPSQVIMEVPDRSAKKFIFRSPSKTKSGYDVLTVTVPERMQASYGLYVWPCAPILAWYLYEHRDFLVGKKILELGAGTALPGVLAALCGAHVTLSDSVKLPHCLEQCEATAKVNGVFDKVNIISLTWGLFLNEISQIGNNLDLIIASDCFYDPVVFEDLIATIAFLLENNPNAKMLCTYQERSSDWSIQHLLSRWELGCKHVPLRELANRCKVDLLGLMQNHTIHLLEISLNSSQP